MNSLILELNGAALVAHDAAPAPQTRPQLEAVPSTARPGLGLQLRGLSKHYGQRQVLQDVSLDIAPGEFVALVGRSGCGKSTLLRLLAQLETANSGQVLADDGQSLAQHHSDVRIMFQDARLLPWKSVVDNIALGLSAKGGQSPRERALEALAQVGLAERANDWPAVLSGGQRQRVALARALVHAPRLLLLDEPLGALDALTRIEMHRLIENLWRRHGFTAVLVTHDVTEAVALADRVLLIEDHHVTLNQALPLPRPRVQGSAAFARHESAILHRVLQLPDAPSTLAEAPPLAGLGPLRFAI